MHDAQLLADLATLRNQIAATTFERLRLRGVLSLKVCVEYAVEEANALVAGLAKMPSENASAAHDILIRLSREDAAEMRKKIRCGATMNEQGEFEGRVESAIDDAMRTVTQEIGPTRESPR